MILYGIRNCDTVKKARAWLASRGIAYDFHDYKTADIYPFDAAFLSRVATRIVDEVRGIKRVVYDYTSKPPATIEWQ